MRAALFLAAALLLLTAAQAADPSVTIGWVYGSPAPPEKSPDGLQTRDYRVQSGLEFWLKRAKSDRKQSALITKAANGDFDAAYAALCTQDQVQYLVGPSSWRGTYEVLTGGNATTACPKEAVWGFLWMDEQLEALANTLGLNWFSLHPRFPNDPLQVYVVSRLLFDQDHYTWSILSQDSVSDPELDRVARFGAAIANMLVTPSAATRNLEFTLFQNATFDLASPTNASVAVNDFVDQLARKRPEVNVLALALSGEDAEFMNFVKQTLFPELDAAGRKEPNPDTVLLLSPVEYYDFTKADRKYIKYWTALAMWDHTFTWKHDSTKSWSMGSPTQYWDDFNDHFDRRPGNWDALATISAVVLDRARTKAGLQNVKLNTFFGPIDFTGVAGNSSLRQADVDKWYAVQFLFGDTSAIGETKAVRKSVDSPGRWKWKSYSLTSSAIAAIVLGVILMIIGLLVAAFAAYKFIGLWLHPPSHSDNEKDDEKEKSD